MCHHRASFMFTKVITNLTIYIVCSWWTSSEIRGKGGGVYCLVWGMDGAVRLLLTGLSDESDDWWVWSMTDESDHYDTKARWHASGTATHRAGAVPVYEQQQAF